MTQFADQRKPKDSSKRVLRSEYFLSYLLIVTKAFDFFSPRATGVQPGHLRKDEIKLNCTKARAMAIESIAHRIAKRP